MINTNMNRNNDPFLLSPAGKDYLWGGKRLRDDYVKSIDMEPLAETWECSVHPDGPSMVATGPHKGRLLPDVLKEFPELLGTRHREKDTFPFLVKMIDASKDLSVQVHPDDDYAREHENGQSGKIEMWYILDASDQAAIYYGLRHSIDKNTLLESIEKGCVEKYLQKIKIHKGDRFFLPPGTIHAIGAGSLIVEIQENSNLTYRMYDYDRVDKNGQKRPLHLEKALDVACLEATAEPRQPMRVFRYSKGCASENLCRCRYFQVDRLVINTALHQEAARLQTDALSFQVLLCTDGTGYMSWQEEELPFSGGDCIFIPADSPQISLYGNAELLKIMG